VTKGTRYEDKVIGILGITAMLGGCAGQAQTFYMDQSGGGSQAVTFPNGTMFDGASNRQASSLARSWSIPTTT
jgi:hypothetical protein